jgi:hypothetical protein
MSQIATTIEQSKKLIDLGLSADTADMYYYKENIFNNALAVFNGQLLVRGNSELKDEDTTPAWSLTALLSMLPKSLIYTPNPLLNGYCCKNLEYDVETYGDDSINAAFKMMCYLLENKLI